MTEGNQMSGRPYGGRNEKPDDEDVLPGERPVSEDEKHVGAPRHTDDDSETASRAAEDGPMQTDEPGLAEPGPGIPQGFGPPSPADATEGDPPGGSTANQRGMTPDQ